MKSKVTALKILSLLVTLLVSGLAMGFSKKEQVPCTALTAINSACWADVEELHPTQFVIGEIEVEKRTKKLAKMNKTEFNSYLKSHPASIVIGPDNVFYLTDGHHLSRVLLSLDKNRIFANIVANLSHLNKQDFESKMLQNHWTWLLDENGKADKSFAELPKNISELTDSPFRTLAWMVRKEEGYTETTEPWADFLWGEFFRSKLEIRSSDKDLSEATAEALTYVHSPEASTLPGFIPKD